MRAVEPLRFILIDGEDFGRAEIVVVLFNGWPFALFWAHMVVADGVDLPSA